MSEPAIIPDVTLERYRLQELPAAEAAEIQRRLATDASLAARLAALHASDESIRAEWPATEMARGIADRLAMVPTHRHSPAVNVMRWALPVAAVILLAVVVVRPTALGPGTGTDAGVDSGDRIKGVDASLAIYRRTDAGSELLSDGTQARMGDLLRIGYKVAEPGYGIILSVDGRGVVTLHLPPDGGRAAALDSTGQVLLDRAYELDDAPKWERFYFITGTAPFEVAPVVSAMQSAALAPDAASLSLPGDLGFVTFELKKDLRP